MRRRKNLSVGKTWALRLLAALLLSGCNGDAPSTLEPHGPAAREIADLSWILFGAATVVYVVVMGYLLLGLFRRRQTVTAEQGPEANEGRRAVVVGGIVVPALILVALFALNVRTLSALTPEDEPALTVEVIGHQWWWELRYPDSSIVTANELHIPVGQDVALRLLSTDVIHSFWVPELQGKMDLIPGDTNTLRLRADRAGVYRGQCAEFCGVQHAKMAMLVIAESPEDFAAWVTRQQQPAALPDNDLTRQGQQVFLGSACVYCHTIEGTNATGTLGPNLTHLASRRTLGAGILPNVRGHLAGWIVNSQYIKPGNKMPPMYLDGADLQALLAYLETLE